MFEFGIREPRCWLSNCNEKPSRSCSKWAVQKERFMRCYFIKIGVNEQLMAPLDDRWYDPGAVFFWGGDIDEFLFLWSDPQKVKNLHFTLFDQEQLQLLSPSVIAFRSSVCIMVPFYDRYSGCLICGVESTTKRGTTTMNLRFKTGFWLKTRLLATW